MASVFPVFIGLDNVRMVHSYLDYVCNIQHKVEDVDGCPGQEEDQTDQK